MAINNFDVLKKMSADNLDIRAFPTVLDARMAGGSGKVVIGVDPRTAFDLLADGRVGAILLVWSAEQFTAIKAELEALEVGDNVLKGDQNNDDRRDQ